MYLKKDVLAAIAECRDGMWTLRATGHVISQASYHARPLCKLFGVLVNHYGCLVGSCDKCPVTRDAGTVHCAAAPAVAYNTALQHGRDPKPAALQEVLYLDRLYGKVERDEIPYPAAEPKQAKVETPAEKKAEPKKRETLEEMCLRAGRVATGRKVKDCARVHAAILEVLIDRYDLKEAHDAHLEEDDKS